MSEADNLPPLWPVTATAPSSVNRWIRSNFTITTAILQHFNTLCECDAPAL